MCGFIIQIERLRNGGDVCCLPENLPTPLTLYDSLSGSALSLMTKETESSRRRGSKRQKAESGSQREREKDGKWRETGVRCVYGQREGVLP